MYKICVQLFTIKCNILKYYWVINTKLVTIYFVLIKVISELYY